MRGRLTPTAPLLLLALAVGSAGTARADGISFLHTAPGEAVEGLPLHISGNVFGAGELDRARVYYRRPGGRYSQIELRPAGGDEYEAVIPGREVRTPAVEYYVVAVDLLGRRSDIFASESNPQSVRVVGEDEEGDEGEKREVRREEKREPVDAGPEEGREPPRKPRPEPAAEDAGPAHPASALEEELAMYGAEDVVSLATKHEQVVSDAPAIASSRRACSIALCQSRSCW